MKLTSYATRVQSATSAVPTNGPLSRGTRFDAFSGMSPMLRRIDWAKRSAVAARDAGGRLAERDALSIMMAYRRGLRASELIALRWGNQRPIIAVCARAMISSTTAVLASA